MKYHLHSYGRYVQIPIELHTQTQEKTPITIIPPPKMTATTPDRRSARLAAKQSSIPRPKSSFQSLEVHKTRSSNRGANNRGHSHTKAVPGPIKRAKARRKIERSKKATPSPKPKKAFPLLALPAEIRLMVYKFALEICGSNILRANRQVHREAQDMVYRHGTLHVKMLSLIKGDDTPYVVMNITRLQNMTIHCNVSDCYEKTRFGAPNVLNQVSWFKWGLDKGERKSCSVMITTESYRLDDYDIVWVTRMMSELKGFENVYVTISEPRLMGNARVKRHSQLITKLSDKAVKSRLSQPKDREVYEKVEKFMGGNFGPGIWNDHKRFRQRYLEFHPLEFQRQRTLKEG